MPSVSPSRTKLWSYSDLLSLRTIYWLRHPKPAEDGPEIPATSMTQVREALRQLADIDLQLWENDAEPMIHVDRGGRIFVGPESQATPVSGSDEPFPEMLDLIRPFASEAGIRGPHLVRPRPHLRIIPGKLAGAPHIERTRLETEALATLARRNVEAGNIYRLYPSFDQAAIDEALDLEAQLASNLPPRIAAAA